MEMMKIILETSIVLILTIIININIDYFILRKNDSLIMTIRSLKDLRYLLSISIICLIEGLLFNLLGLSNTFFMYYLIIIILYKMSELDIKTKKINVSLIIFFMICALITQVWNDEVNIVNSILTSIITFCILGLVSKATHESLGMGDAEVLAILGFVIGYEGLISVLLMSSFIVCAYGIGVLIKSKKNKEIPYIPFIFLSLIALIVLNNISI